MALDINRFRVSVSKIKMLQYKLAPLRSDPSDFLSELGLPPGRAGEKYVQHLAQSSSLCNKKLRLKKFDAGSLTAIIGFVPDRRWQDFRLTDSDLDDQSGCFRCCRQLQDHCHEHVVLRGDAVCHVERQFERASFGCGPLGAWFCDEDLAGGPVYARGVLWWSGRLR